ncbi:MAG: MBL fold metallo-hydrolase [Cytophagales bacterium]|nr:MBL fold metallo-hydrolase [Cytophagales bacterium]
MRYIILLLLIFGCKVKPSLKDSINLTYYGAAGWEINDENTTVLLDPYISRIKLVGSSTTTTVTSSDIQNLGQTDDRPSYNREDFYVTDTVVVDKYIKKADYIFVHHTHFDHAADVPYIAKKTGAVVIGTESMANLLKAHGIPGNQIITVKGGEDYQFEHFSVKVIPSLHSALRNKLYFNSGIISADHKIPLKIKDYVEGNSLMFYFRFKSKNILTMGSMNFIEDNIKGLEPNILLAGSANSRKNMYKYNERLLSSTGYPEIIIPTHWDNFRVPYGFSQDKDIKSKALPFIQEVEKLNIRSKIILPKHLETLSF